VPNEVTWPRPAPSFMHARWSRYVTAPGNASSIRRTTCPRGFDKRRSATRAAQFEHDSPRIRIPDSSLCSLSVKPRRRGKRGAYACGRGSGPGLPDLARHEAASPRQEDSSRSAHDTAVQMSSREAAANRLRTHPSEGPGEKRARSHACGARLPLPLLFRPKTPAKNRAPLAETHQSSARNPRPAR
jgi:hypothetical protein